MKTKISALFLCAAALLFGQAADGPIGPTSSTGGTDSVFAPGTSLRVSYGMRIVYVFSGLPQIAYRLDLVFVEPTYKTTGQRPLNVVVNDSPFLSAFDVFAAGGFAAPLKRSMVVAPDDAGKITVVLTANNTGTTANPIAHKAIITAISAVRLSGSGGGGQIGPPGPAGPTGAIGPAGPMGPSGPPGSGSGGGSAARGCEATLQDAHTLAMSGCTIKVNNIPYAIQNGTVTVSSGTGSVRVGIDSSVSPPIGRVYSSRLVTAGCRGMNGCTAAEAGDSFSPEDIQLFAWSVSNGAFDSLNGGTDLRSIESTFRYRFTSLDCVQSGVSITCSPSQ